MKLTIGIVTYNNSFDKLDAVIKSVLSTNLKIRLFIVDNSSSEKIRDLCTDSRIEYIHNPSNPGFGTAHNMAIKRAGKYNPDYHLILNPDIYFSNGVLEGLTSFMDDNQGIGLVMPKVLYPNGSLQYLCKLLPRPIDSIVRRFVKNPKILENYNHKYELRSSGYNRIMDVPFLSGCFMFCRLNVLNKVEGFDEQFFMYFEDTDLSRRMNEVSRTVFYPGVQVYHHFGKESYVNMKLFKYHIDSAIKYFNKWGWFFDSKRKIINGVTLSNLK